MKKKKKKNEETGIKGSSVDKVTLHHDIIRVGEP